MDAPLSASHLRAHRCTSVDIVRFACSEQYRLVSRFMRINSIGIERNQQLAWRARHPALRDAYALHAHVLSNISSDSDGRLFMAARRTSSAFLVIASRFLRQWTASRVTIRSGSQNDSISSIYALCVSIRV